jgi:hypothetical protein
MMSSRGRVLALCLMVVVAMAALVSSAYAAPTIPVGAGWNVHHSAYPGYCLDCHTGFAKSPPTITAGATPPHGDRGSTCTQCHVVKAAPAPLPSGPKPKILSAGFSNPVAYDIASLQKTTFRTSTDVSGARAVLTLRTSAGNKTIWSGTLPKANAVVALPAWNGMVGGRRMATGSFDWDLKVTTTGGTTATSGKILLSKIYFGFSGVTAPGATRVHTGYTKAGFMNVYVSAGTSSAGGTFTLAAHRGTSYSAGIGSWYLASGSRLGATSYLSGGKAVPSPGLTDFLVGGTAGANYKVSVVQ